MEADRTRSSPSLVEYCRGLQFVSVKSVLLAEWLNEKKNLIYRELLETDLAAVTRGASDSKGGYSDAPISVGFFFFSDNR